MIHEHQRIPHVGGRDPVDFHPLLVPEPEHRGARQRAQAGREQPAPDQAGLQREYHERVRQQQRQRQRVGEPEGHHRGRVGDQPPEPVLLDEADQQQGAGDRHQDRDGVRPGLLGVPRGARQYGEEQPGHQA
jgi:hypothetical protein